MLTFWGKAQPSADAAVHWHPIAYHLLDVAAVADAWLEERPIVRARAGELLGLEPEQAHRLVVALTALHDLGKFAPSFQAKAQPHGWIWPAELGARNLARFGTRHTDDGYALWRDALGPVRNRLWPAGRRTLDVLAPAIFGHHGRPISTGLTTPPAESVFGTRAVAIASSCAEALVMLLHPTPIETSPPATAHAKVASWWLAGLVTIADWIGSNRGWFPYAVPDHGDVTLSVYWALTRASAKRAIKAAGLLGPAVAPSMDFAALVKGGKVPTPAQAWAASVELPPGPLLIILEDVTGSGKTEAAQFLVHRLMAEGRAGGAYWAMPTKASANAMYERQAEAIGALYVSDSDRRPSIVLTHGQSHLHDRFRTSVLRNAAEAGESRSAGPTRDAELPAGAACAAFLADDSRAALLADVGAGSVDQVLQGVLPSRFNAVRLFALSEKVLVVDEAHAYDAYMDVELQELLRFQGALRGCAVVLSATLPTGKRANLMRAWQDGLDNGRRATAVEAPVMHADYPLATVVSSGGCTEFRLEAAPWSRRSVDVRFVNDAASAVEHVVRSAGLGAAVAWVRNTVADCLDGAAALRERGVKPLVFHARFTHMDRQVREGEVVTYFGENSLAEQRRGRVLVATQVVEQSLDLDFDAMVSDLAPVDLLVQRAGRLHRHEARSADRPPGLHRELVVLAPLWNSDPAASWLAEVLPRTGHVYEDIGVLWRTARALMNTGEIRTPDGLRELIEEVYGSDENPLGLQRKSDQARSARSAYAAAGNYATLKPADGYTGTARVWMDDVCAPTRLGEADTTVRLARVTAAGDILPWARGSMPPATAWALSEVRLAAWRVPAGSSAPRYSDAVDALRTGWRRHEREIPVLPLIEAGDGTWRGMLAKPSGEAVGLTYSPAEGMRFQPGTP